jgi:4-carboxymuconolactone decarboxylase
VLDLDSPVPGRFDEDDRRGCEQLAALFVAHLRRPVATAADIDPDSGCRLPLPRREDLGAEGQQIYDRLADPDGGTLRGLRGPGGIQLHSPELSRHSRPVNHYLRYQAGLGGRARELAILATARELDSRFEWAAHEPAALAAGISPEIVEIIRWRGDTAGLTASDAVVIDLAREIFGDRRVRSETYAHALRFFGLRRLVDLVALMGHYASTAALLTAFDMRLDGDRAAGLPIPAAAKPSLRPMNEEFDRLLTEIRACAVCAPYLPLGPRPVVRGRPSARLLIISQAPGTRVHETGLSFNDRSGERLRLWLGLDRERFYDESRVAIMPVGFCYPGRDAKGGDLPPRAECAPLWHARLRASLTEIELTCSSAATRSTVACRCSATGR